MLTSPLSSAPVIGGRARTADSISCLPGSASPLKTPPRMAPRSLRWRVSARVSAPAIPVTPWRASSASSDRVQRQLEGLGAGLRTTYPDTQIRPDSLSSSFQPVLPICGAVCTTIWPRYDGSVSVSWYPVMLVQNTTSPRARPCAPYGTPRNALPSSSIRTADGCSFITSSSRMS